MSKNKREFDRHPGTGGSIKADAKRSGAGQGNWGDDKAVIGEAVKAHKETEQASAETTTNPPTQPPKDDLVSPENLGELTATEEKPKDVSYEEYVKQQSRSGVKAYDSRTVANSNFRADRYKGKNQFEKATDELLQGAQKEKKKRKKARKQQKIIKPEYSFHPASGIPDRAGGAPRGRGRGRGRGGGEGGFSNRPYGASAGGDRGGYSRGYGGFGSRGRGRRNDENVDNNMPHQRPPPQYRLKNENQEATTTAPPHQHNNENMSIPQPIA